MSTLTFLQGQVQQRLAFSPAVVGDGAPVAIVIRLDDSLHAAWRGPEEDDPALAAALGARLSAVLALASRSAVPIAEVQLDYDCPVRHLRRWAGVLRALVEGPLRGRELWLTSLVAHARQPGYGDLFRGLVAGHVVQVFDTGDRAEGDAAAALLRALEAQRMPFRLGVGAFERVGTAHAAWFDAVPAISRSPWYRGLWIFPGGQRWLPLLGSP